MNCFQSLHFFSDSQYRTCILLFSMKSYPFVSSMLWFLIIDYKSTKAITSRRVLYEKINKWYSSKTEKLNEPKQYMNNHFIIPMHIFQLLFLFMVFNATSTICQLYLGFSFIGARHWNTLRKPSTCCKSLTNMSRIWTHTVSRDRHWPHR